MLTSLTGWLAHHLVMELLLLQSAFEIESRALLGYAIMRALAAGVIGVTMAAERRLLSTLGLRRLPARLALLGVGIGVLLSLLVLSLAAHALTGTGEVGRPGSRVEHAAEPIDDTCLGPANLRLRDRAP